MGSATSHSRCLLLCTLLRGQFNLSAILYSDLSLLNVNFVMFISIYKELLDQSLSACILPWLLRSFDIYLKLSDDTILRKILYVRSTSSILIYVLFPECFLIISLPHLTWDDSPFFCFLLHYLFHLFFY